MHIRFEGDGSVWHSRSAKPSYVGFRLLILEDDDAYFFDASGCQLSLCHVRGQLTIMSGYERDACYDSRVPGSVENRPPPIPLNNGGRGKMVRGQSANSTPRREMFAV